MNTNWMSHKLIYNYSVHNPKSTQHSMSLENMKLHRYSDLSGHIMLHYTHGVQLCVMPQLSVA